METWYVLEDGAVADPRDVSPDAGGVLRHKSGVAVAMRGDVPSSRSVDPNQERTKSQPKPKPRAKDMKPDEPKAGYATRESKPE
jgi:hypothetical protein